MMKCAVIRVIIYALLFSTTHAAITIDPDNTNATDVVQDPLGSPQTLANPLPDHLVFDSVSVAVGAADTGELLIDNGSSLSHDGIGYIGLNSGSVGATTVTGGGSNWTIDDTLNVAYDGEGILNIEAGGRVSSATGFIGRGIGSSGEVNVSGIGSTFVVSDGRGFGGLYVGGWGTGTLNVEAGGQLNTDIATIGLFQDSVGLVNVSGDGSRWDVYKSLKIGYFGSSTLRIENSGVVHSGSDGYIGSVSGSSGEMIVSGSGSKWISYRLHVGEIGLGTLTIEEGGVVESRTGYGRVGEKVGSTGIANVTGDGSRWDLTSSPLTVGYSGSGTLTIEEGGAVNSRYGFIGLEPNSIGEVSVTGRGSRWAATDDFIVGRYGDGRLNITNGGTLSVGGAFSIDHNANGESFINMSFGGKLALLGDADDSLSQFLALIAGTDAIRFWDDGLSSWQPLTSAILGTDYSLHYLSSGELSGYTLLTVGNLGDFNGDGSVDGLDFLSWQVNPSLGPLADWENHYGTTYAATSNVTTVPEPGSVSLLLGALCWVGRCRR